MARRGLAIAALALIAASTPVSALPEPRILDITAFRETFSEDFRGTLDVTAWGPSRWIAHTPWSGDFGDAAFADPAPGFPFQTGPGGLRIIARKGEDGRWRSGLLSSVGKDDVGFKQSDGYFEARMKMPPGPGTWPAFWLVNHGDPNHHTEIDVVEYYGHGTDWYQLNYHLWPKHPGAAPAGDLKTIRVRANSLVEDFHTYGVEVTRDDIVFYLDRAEVARMPAPPAAHQPLSMLVNLALGSGWPIDKTPNPSVLEVDYVKAFQRK